MEHDSLSVVDELIRRAKAGTLSTDEAAAAYAAIAALRAQADRYERDLIRSLRWDSAGNVMRTWAEVAEAVQAQLSSRQAAHARWGRLKSPARRTTTGDARRGAARPRRSGADGSQ
jgi:hypothetical protein